MMAVDKDPSKEDLKEMSTRMVGMNANIFVSQMTLKVVETSIDKLSQQLRDESKKNADRFDLVQQQLLGHARAIEQLMRNLSRSSRRSYGSK